MGFNSGFKGLIRFLTADRDTQSVQRLATGGWCGGSNLGWGDIFRIRPDRPWVPQNGYWIFPGGKTAEEWLLPPTTSNAEVTERVEQHIYSPSVPLCPVLRWTLPLLSSTFNLKTEWSQDKSSHIRVKYVLSRIKFLFIVVVSVTTYSCAQKWNKNNLAAPLSPPVCSIWKLLHGCCWKIKSNL